MSAVSQSRISQSDESLPGLSWARMREQHLAVVHAIEKAAYESPWTEGNFRDSLSAGYQCWVCHEGGRGVEHMLGYFVMLIGVGEAHLLNLCVAVPRQRHGFGRQVLDQAMVVALAHGASRLILEVRPTNLPGQRLYARAGFREIGRRRDYYPALGGREDALVLARALA